MKDLIARLKSRGFKQLAIDHGEKLVVGLLGLLLLVALVTTSWSRYDKTPQQLTQEVNKVKTAIAQNTWADSEDAKKGVYTVAAGLKEEQVRQLLTSDDKERAEMVEQRRLDYEYSANMVQSLIRRLEPARQPVTLPPDEMIASYGRAYIPQAAVYDESQFEDDPAQDDEERSRLRDNFIDAGAGGFRGPAGGGPGPAGGPMPGGGRGSGRGAPGLPGAAGPGGPGMGMGMGMGMGGGTEANGMRFVSVRGIVPLYRQIEQIANARNVSHREAAAMVEYWDFKLERRAKPMSGAFDWSEWEPVDIRTAGEVLNDAAGWDPEIIDISLTDEVLTMSLPTRVLYNWMKDEVSHPKLDRYVLSPSQRDRQMEIYEAYLDQQIDEIGYLKQQEKRGLSRFQKGDRQMGMMGGPGMGMPGMGMAGRGMATRGAAGAAGRGGMQMTSLVDRLAKELDKDNPDRVKQDLLKQIMASQDAAGRLLLFRYLDFDVKPGTTYQYRVQLELVNPNFGLPQQLVVDATITRDRYLKTPFSEPTAPVTVPHDVNFYVARVDHANGPNPPSATFDVYQWSTEFGTTINQQLKVLLGAFVGDRTKADVVDPAKPEYLKGIEVEFKSDDVLVDINAAPRSIDVEEHPDLKQLPREKLLKGLGVSEQALLVNEAGELVAFDPASMAAAYEKTKKQYEQEQKDVESIKEGGAAGEGGPGFDRYERDFGGPAAGPGTGGAGKRGSGNAMRRGGGRGGAAGRGAMDPMGPMGPMGPAGGGAPGGGRRR